MIIYNTDFYQVSLDESQLVAILYWKREVALAEFKEGCLALREIIRSNHLHRWLINSTHKGFLAPEAEEWLNSTVFAPGGDNVLNHHIAFVMTEEKYQDMVHDYSLLRARHKNLPLELNYFTRMEEALHWLVHEQAMVPY